MLIRYIKKVDFLLLFTVCFISVFGLIAVYSSSYPIGILDHNNPKYFFDKQVRSFIIGLILLAITCFIPSRIYGKLSPIFIMISILILIAMLLPGIGVERNNAQRWLQLGPIVIQPSEAIKLVMIIYFAHIYAKKQGGMNDFMKDVMPPLIILAVVFLLILSQPDLGSATALLIPCGFILLCSGARAIHLILLGSTAVGGIIFLAQSSPYRLERMLTFQDPFNDPMGSGYQLINSYYAITSGGVWGSGFGKSILKHGYLPEAHTDFIMAIISEELGAVGIMLVIFSFLLIMYCGVRIAAKSKETYSKLLAIGLTFQILVQAIFNLGAVCGLLPVTGVPLPFISYGGSSLIFMMISTGILLNLSIHSNGFDY